MSLQKSVRRNLAFFVLFISTVSSVSAASILSITQLDLKTYHGKVVYLDFWASWCKPCQKSFPWMNRLQQRFNHRDFQIVTINLDSDKAAMNAFLERVPANFDIFHDPSGSLAETFKLDGMPTSYLIDRQGHVVKRHIGFQTESIPSYEMEIEALL